MLRIMANTWPVLEKLHALNHPIIVTNLAKEIRTNKSTVSKNIKSLESLEPKVLFTEPLSREGRPYKSVQLTDQAYPFIDAIVKFAKGSSQEALSEIPDSDVSDAIERFLIGKTQEAKEIAWLDLQSYAVRTKLWKHEKIWLVIEPRLLVDSPTGEFNQAFSVYTKMLARAFQEGKERNPVAKRAKMNHLTWLMQVVKSSDGKWHDHRHEIMGLFKYIMREEGWLERFWDTWVSGTREISNNQEYEAFTTPFSSYLKSNNQEMSKRFRERLFQLLEDPDETVRPRARDMYRMLFH